MRIAVLWTGPVGQTVAAKLAELGHEVTVGTRDVEATMAHTEPDTFGRPPFSEWAADYPGIAVAPVADAAAAAELVVNATNGAGSIATLEAAGEENLAGKVLIDIANPLDFSQGMPPSLFASNTDSLVRPSNAASPARGW
jgi:8-hydroxy-5-deazaflavin:NADPH oxidoreductase